MAWSLFKIILNSFTGYKVNGITDVHFWLLWLRKLSLRWSLLLVGLEKYTQRCTNTIWLWRPCVLYACVGTNEIFKRKEDIPGVEESMVKHVRF